MNWLELLFISFIITGTITGLCEMVEDYQLSKWTIVLGDRGYTLPYKDDEEFDAVIRHLNNPLKLKNQRVRLKMGSDCLYFQGCKMSWNWDIVMHRPVKRGRSNAK